MITAIQTKQQQSGGAIQMKELALDAKSECQRHCLTACPCACSSLLPPKQLRSSRSSFSRQGSYTSAVRSSMHDSDEVPGACAPPACFCHCKLACSWS